MNDIPRNGLSSAEYNKMDVTRFNIRINQSLDAITHDKPVIMDICAGGGRDIVHMRDYLISQGKTPIMIAVDNDFQRHKDAKKHFPDTFLTCYTPEEISTAIGRDKIAYLYDDLPHIHALRDTGLKADFMLCSAGIMFLPSQHLTPAFNTMADLLKTGGELMVRYSNYRPSPYPNGYNKHKLDNVMAAFNNVTTLKPEYIGDIRDANWDIAPKRQFYWHDIRALKK